MKSALLALLIWVTAFFSGVVRAQTPPHEVHDPRLGFSFVLPEGFDPEDKFMNVAPNVIYGYFRQESGRGIGTAIIIDRLDGTIGRELPKRPANFAGKTFKLPWHGFDIYATEEAGNLNGVAVDCVKAYVPLKPEAIVVSVMGSPSHAAESQAQLRLLLGGLSGLSNWDEPPNSQAPARPPSNSPPPFGQSVSAPITITAASKNFKGSLEFAVVIVAMWLLFSIVGGASFRGLVLLLGIAAGVGAQTLPGGDGPQMQFVLIMLKTMGYFAAAFSVLYALWPRSAEAEMDLHPHRFELKRAKRLFFEVAIGLALYVGSCFVLSLWNGGAWGFQGPHEFAVACSRAAVGAFAKIRIRLLSGAVALAMIQACVANASLATGAKSRFSRLDDRIKNAFFYGMAWTAMTGFFVVLAFQNINAAHSGAANFEARFQSLKHAIVYALAIPWGIIVLISLSRPRPTPSVVLSKPPKKVLASSPRLTFADALPLSLPSKAAEAGDINAMRQVGMMYEFGVGIEKDLLKAMAWYQKAADAVKSAPTGQLQTETLTSVLDADQPH
jgi:hypothetical protein